MPKFGATTIEETTKTDAHDEIPTKLNEVSNEPYTRIVSNDGHRWAKCGDAANMGRTGNG